MAGLNVILAPITRRCSVCDSHHGFSGSKGFTTLCSARGEVERIGIGSGKCPRGFWDASDTGKKPIVYDPPKSGRFANSDQLTAIHNSGRGRILIIVANGPSHREAALERLRCEPFDFLCVNKPDPRIWPAKYWAFVDPSQIIRHRETWRDYTGTIISNGAAREFHPRQITVKSASGFQIDLARNGANVGGTTTHFAMQAGLWMGYDHIYIFGLDMSANKDGQLYAWGTNPDVEDKQRAARFPSENHTLCNAGKILGGMASRFTACSAYAIARDWAFLKYFEAIDHEIAVETILKRHALELVSSPA